MPSWGKFWGFGELLDFSVLFAEAVSGPNLGGFLMLIPDGGSPQGE